MWHKQLNHIYTCHICAKGFSDSNSNETVTDKKLKFLQNSLKFDIPIKDCNFWQDLERDKPTPFAL